MSIERTRTFCPSVAASYRYILRALTLPLLDSGGYRLRTQINVRLPAESAAATQQTLRMCAAALTLRTGSTHSIGDAVAEAAQCLARELGVTARPTRQYRKQTDR